MKLQAGVWVVGSMAILHYTDFVHALLNDERIYRYELPHVCSDLLNVWT